MNMNQSDFLTLDPKELTTRQMHLYLLSSVAPRPIALASTVDQDGNVNLSPFSFFNVFSANPPIMIFSPAKRGRDSSDKHTYLNIKEIPEVAINIVTYQMVQQVSLSSTEYKKGVNEFTKSGLTEIPSELIRPPRVAESPVAFECLVDDVIELGTEGGAGNLVIARVVTFHINKAILDENGNVVTPRLDLVGRMGGMYYSRASGDAIFEIDKPSLPEGIGVDVLPEHVRNSTVLTGNDLGKLGGNQKLPSIDEIRAVRNSDDFGSLILQGNVQSLHQEAQKLIKENQVSKALVLLFSV